MTTLKFRNNDEMPILGLGTFRSEPNEVYNAVLSAIKIGYRHIDCAAAYGNEKEVGNAIADAIKQGLVSREDLWVTSKLWNASHGEENVIPALNQTLEDLQLDYLDLYLIHWPVALKKERKCQKKHLILFRFQRYH
ncbi:aldo/keto reductase [Maribacter stanieri]|uniref:aldo/keto reductase n=1 Tax=Maribacter stanieri TaxID=440514 RepID=UPI000A6F64CF|nr:aldo/keto reductase [Maribacter stanieri]